MPRNSRLQWVANSSAAEAEEAEMFLTGQKARLNSRESDDWEVRSTGMSSVPEGSIVDNAEDDAAIQRLLKQHTVFSEADGGDLPSDGADATLPPLGKSTELVPADIMSAGLAEIKQDARLPPNRKPALASSLDKGAVPTRSAGSSGQSSRDRYDELLKKAALKEAQMTLREAEDLPEVPLQPPPARDPVRQLEVRGSTKSLREVDVEMERLREIEERIQQYKAEDKKKDTAMLTTSPPSNAPAAPEDDVTGSKLAKYEIDKWQAEAKVVAAERESAMLREQLTAEVSKRRELEAYARSMEDLLPMWREKQSKMSNMIEERAISVKEQADEHERFLLEAGVQQGQVTQEGEDLQVPTLQPLPPNRPVAGTPPTGSPSQALQAPPPNTQWRTELQAQFEATLQDIYKVQEENAVAKKDPEKPNVGSEIPPAQVPALTEATDKKSLDTVEAITERLSKAEAAFVQQQLLFSEEWTHLKQQLAQMQATQATASTTKADHESLLYGLGSLDKRADDQGSSQSTPSAPRYAHGLRAKSSHARSSKRPGRQTSVPAGSRSKQSRSTDRDLIYPGQGGARLDLSDDGSQASSHGLARVPSAPTVQSSPRKMMMVPEGSPHSLARVPSSSNAQASPRDAAQIASETDTSALRRNIRELLNNNMSLDKQEAASEASMASSSVTVLTKEDRQERQGPPEKRTRSPVNPASRVRSASVKVSPGKFLQPSSSLRVPAAGSIVARLENDRQSSTSMSAEVLHGGPTGPPTEPEVRALTEWIAKAVAGGGPDLNIMLNARQGGQEEAQNTAQRRTSSPMPARGSSNPPVSGAVHRSLSVAGGSVTIGVGGILELQKAAPISGSLSFPVPGAPAPSGSMTLSVGGDAQQAPIGMGSMSLPATILDKQAQLGMGSMSFPVPGLEKQGSLISGSVKMPVGSVVVDQQAPPSAGRCGSPPTNLRQPPSKAGRHSPPADHRLGSPKAPKPAKRSPSSTPKTSQDYVVGDSSRRPRTAQGTRPISSVQAAHVHSPRHDLTLLAPSGTSVAAAPGNLTSSFKGQAQTLQPSPVNTPAYRSVTSSPASSVAFPPGNLGNQRMITSPGAGGRAARHTPSATPVQGTPITSWVPQGPAGTSIVLNAGMSRQGAPSQAVTGSAAHWQTRATF